jgi:salicylate hydroxylase
MAGPILIAGGGIGGLALALALARIGRSSIVIERRETFATAGAGIQLGPNGTRALQRLGIADALAPLVGTPDVLGIMHGASGARIATLPLGSWIADRHGAPYWVAHRGDLLATLLAAASEDWRITLRSGFDVATIAQDVSGVRATSTSGETILASALVGADGLWSRVRRALQPAVLPAFVGATATRTVMAAAKAGRLNSNGVGLWLTPGVHVVHYPVRGGREIAVVVITAEAWQSTDWETDADKGQLFSRLCGFDASLIEVLAHAPAWRKWALHRLPPLNAWSQGRVTLLGDAAHSMLPYLAQGGALALEDALVLSQCLTVHAADDARAFSAYEDLRRRRAARVEALSWRMGRIYQLGPPLAWGRDSVLRVIPGSWLMAGYDWLYGWRP